MATLHEIAVTVARIEERLIAQGNDLAELKGLRPEVDALKAFKTSSKWYAVAFAFGLTGINGVKSDAVISILQALLS